VSAFHAPFVLRCAHHILRCYYHRIHNLETILLLLTDVSCLWLYYVLLYLHHHCLTKIKSTIMKKIYCCHLWDQGAWFCDEFNASKTCTFRSTASWSNCDWLFK
jgi:hypothetical protein